MLPARLAIVFLLLASTACLAAVATEAVPATAPAGQMVLLKIDDLGRDQRHGDSLPYDRWLRTLAFLKEEGIAANVGLFIESLDGDCPRYCAWLKEQAAGGQVEFWYHAWYAHGLPAAQLTPPRTGEFQGATAAEQGDLLRRGFALMQEKTGIAMVAYGPHGAPLAGADAAAAYTAMAGIPQIRAVWFYGPPAGTVSDKVLIPRTCELEKPLFKPNAANVRATFAAMAGQVPVLAMQGHPGTWDDERFAEFRTAMLYLKSQGCRFMTVSGYLATRAGDHDDGKAGH